jgi:myo-inositol-1(or 4)-monophosphatase
MYAWNVERMGKPPAEAEPAIRAVAEALDLALARGGAGDVTHKDARDIVTADDVRIEDRIRAGLGEALGYEVVGEERGGETSESGSYWMLDPICGTRNYASGIPLYCVNLALVRDGAPVLAVVGDPSTGEVLVARLGGGAWALGRDGGARSLRADTSSQTLIIEDGKSTGPRRDQAAEFFAAAVRANRWDLRTLSSTLSLAYLAAGRVSAYAVFYVTAVHSTAGALVAAEAGAVVTDIEGRPWTLDSDSLLAAADPALHAELLAPGGFDALRDAGVGVAARAARGDR